MKFIYSISSFYIPHMFSKLSLFYLQLLARIERMERRLQLTRKDVPRDKRLFQPLETWTPDKEDIWDLDIEESPQPNAATPLPFSKGQKR